MPLSPIHPTRTSGDLVVSFTLTDESGRPAAHGDVTLPLRPDWRWNIDFFNRTTDPTETCFGCVGRQAFELPPHLRAPGHELLWIVWGGNSMSKPVVH